MNLLKTINKKHSTKILEKDCDKLWAQAVKRTAGYQCEFCGKTERLCAHHFYSRSIRSLRWRIENGVCLCTGHHKFVAHKFPLKFIEWFKEKRKTDFHVIEEIYHCNKKETVDLSLLKLWFTEIFKVDTELPF